MSGPPARSRDEGRAAVPDRGGPQPTEEYPMKLTLSLLTLAALLSLGWTCRYRYSSVRLGYLTGMARTQRFTGETQILWPGVGWRPAGTPGREILSAAFPDR